MVSPTINKIKDIRQEDALCLLDESNNRYCISVKELESVSSYLFNVPIRDFNTNKLSDCNWTKKQNAWESYGVAENSKIIATENSIILTRLRMQCELFFPFKNIWNKNGELLISDKINLSLNTNGILASIECSGEENVVLEIESDEIKDGIQKNTQYFAFMESQFKPDVILAALFYKEYNGNMFPVQISIEKISDLRYKIIFNISNKHPGNLYFEFNFHEEKLFQDTTVSEERSLENNAFGSVAFLGHTAEYGEQRFYIKLMLDQLYNFAHRKIEKLKLYIPKLSVKEKIIEAHQLETRFCSFGSTWESKKPYSDNRVPILYEKNYIVLDLTSYMAPNGRINYTYGLMIKMDQSESGNLVISTGDSCSFPIILQIVYEI